jgi:hypothetical protein
LSGIICAGAGIVVVVVKTLSALEIPGGRPRCALKGGNLSQVPPGVRRHLYVFADAERVYFAIITDLYSGLIEKPVQCAFEIKFDKRNRCDLNSQGIRAEG